MTAHTDTPEASPILTRRNMLLGGVALTGLAAAGGWRLHMADRFEGGEMTPPQVMSAMASGDVLLIDIRRPDEWEKTGIAEGAHPIDMRRADFLVALKEVTGGRTDTPIALICARGVRSDRMSARLTDAGFTNIIDVPEGMLGSRAGPGWLERGLPVIQL